MGYYYNEVTMTVKPPYNGPLYSGHSLQRRLFSRTDEMTVELP